MLALRELRSAHTRAEESRDFPGCCNAMSSAGLIACPHTLYPLMQQLSSR